MRTSLADFNKAGRYNLSVTCKFVYDSDVKTKVWLEDDENNVITAQAQDKNRWKKGNQYCIYGLQIAHDGDEFVGKIDRKTTITSPPSTRLTIVGSLSELPYDRWGEQLSSAQAVQAHFDDITSQAFDDVSQAVIHIGTLCQNSDLLQHVFEPLAETGVKIYHVPVNPKPSYTDPSVENIEILLQDTVTHGELNITGWAPHAGVQCPTPKTDPDVFVVGDTPFACRYSPTVKEVIDDLPCSPSLVVFRGQGQSYVQQSTGTTALFTSDLNRWHPESITGWYVIPHGDGLFYQNETATERPSYEKIRLSGLQAGTSKTVSDLRTTLEEQNIAVIESEKSIHPREFKKLIHKLESEGKKIPFRNRWQLVPRALFSGPIWDHFDCDLKTDKPNRIDEAMKSEYHHYFALLDDPPLQLYTPTPVFSLYRHEVKNKEIKNKIKSGGNIIEDVPLEEQFEAGTAEMITEFYDLVYRRFITGLIKYDVVTVYPTSSGGYNQLLQDIARRLSAQSTLEYQPLIERQATETPQKCLNSKKERYDNTAGELKLIETVDSSIAGKNILVIDDVVTSGASMVLTARKLIAAGAKSVAGASFTMTGSYKNRQRIKSAWLDVGNAARSAKIVDS